MRKTGNRRTSNYGLKPKAPILVMRTIEQNKLETREWRAVNVFAHGLATAEDFYQIQDVVNLLLIAGQSSPERRYALLHTEKEFKPVLMSIQKRWERTGKWGVTIEELDKLRAMVVFNADFWKRQTTELLIVCVAEAKAFYKEQMDARVAA